MKILICGINYFPELTGIGKYSGEMAEWLFRNGHSVRVISAPPYYPDWKVSEPYSGSRYYFENPDGVGIFRCPLWVPRKPSGLKRLVHLASYAISSFPIVLCQAFWRPDVVIAIAPTLFCAPSAVLTAKLSGAKAWLHIQDYEVDAAYELGLLRGRGLRRVVFTVECWFMRGFDRVSTISNRMLDRLAAKGVHSSRTVLFPNWVDVEQVFPLDRPSDYRSLLGIPSQAIVVLYSGNIGNKQGLEILPQVAELLTDRADIRFVFCGNGAGRGELVAACAGMANVQFLDLQPVDRLNELLGLADIHLLPQRAGAADLVMPSKLTGMLASGRPVLVTAAPETQLARVVEGCGLVVPPELPDRIAEGLRFLADDARLRTRLGLAAREYAVRHLGKDQVLTKFLDDLERLCAEPF